MSAKLSLHTEGFEKLRLASIQPGDVFLGELEGVDHEKFFVIAGVSGDRVLCCSVLINSKINPFIKKRPHMLERQLELLATDYEFLSHDSYVNCAQPLKSKLEFFASTGYRYRGSLKEEDVKTIKDFLITSGQLSQEEIELYFS